MPGPYPRFEDVDPRTLYVNSQRPHVDLFRLHMQIARFGASQAGMDPVEVEEDPDGKLVIMNGMTRATRIAKLAPGTRIRVAVTTRRRQPLKYLVTVADTLP